MSDPIAVHARTVHHIRIDSRRPYAQFRADYEAVVPAFDRLEAIGVVLSGAGWAGIEGLSAATAVHGLVNFFTFDPSPVMALRGNTGHTVTYLAGNIIKAEPGFRADPGSFLYIPLRIAISETTTGTGEISFDLPTDLFAALDGDAVAAVGREFNAALLRVLTLLDLKIPTELRTD